jgi:hypothetical protein
MKQLSYLIFPFIVLVNDGCKKNSSGPGGSLGSGSLGSGSDEWLMGGK